MEICIEFEKKEIGSLPYEAIPALFLFLRENGLQFNYDEKNRRVQLQQGLKGKNLILIKEPISDSHSVNRLEQDLFDGITNFLKSCGASLFIKEHDNVNTDLYITLGILEDLSEDKPRMEVLHDVKIDSQRWLFVLKEECKETGIQFASRSNPAETKPHMKFLIKIPESLQTPWQSGLTKFQIIITMGILARLQANSPLFPLSYLPIHKFSLFLNDSRANSTDERKIVRNVSNISKTQVMKNYPLNKRENIESASSVINDEKTCAAEAFFDYQVILDSTRDDKILLFGNFIIKNTGGEALQNPVICFRMAPQSNINFSGQLVPPAAAQTLAVLNSEKGWKYMYDDWFQQIEEKGEIWICPVKPLTIPSGQAETFRNYRISIQKDENQRNLMLEGFVFFREQGLEYRANNSISLSF